MSLPDSAASSARLVDPVNKDAFKFDGSTLIIGTNLTISTFE
jgi:hypothetical protein